MVSKSLILFLFLAAIPQAIMGDVTHKRVPDCVVSESVKKLMKKHGVHTMYQGWDGKWWFKRDGKKIFLEGKDE